MAILKTATGEQAKKLLTEKDGKYRVFLFGATWCGACQETTIQLGIAATELKHIGFYKVDIDKDEKLADKYIKDAVPYIVLIRNGRKVKALEGYDDAEAWIEWIEEATEKGKK